MKAAIAHPIEQLNALMAAQTPTQAARKPNAPQVPNERWRRYFEPVPGLSKDLPVPILGVMVLIWQLRHDEMHDRYPLDTVENRLDFIAWCVAHGGREYQSLREADQFWTALGQPATFPGKKLAADDAGHAISWLMVLLMRQRADLRSDLGTPDGRKQLLTWYVLHGQRELPHVKQVFQPWQTDYLFGASAIPGLNRLHVLVHDALPQVQKAFPLPASMGQYLTWLRKYLCVTTRLVDNLSAAWKPDASQDPAASASQPQGQTQTQSQAREYPPGINVIGYVFGQLGIGEDARMAGKALLTTGVPCTMVDLPPGKEIPQHDRSMAAHVSPAPVYATNMFCLTALEQGRHFAERGLQPIQGRRNIGYWPWELPRFPRQWQHLLSLVDEVWASTDHVAHGLDGASPAINTSVPVHVMPMAVELTEPSSKTRKDFNLPPKAKLFIFAFDLNSSATRKNPVACLQAFKKAFPAKAKKALGPQEVGLVIKVHPLAQDNQEWEMLKQLRADDPRIHLIEQTLGKADLMALYLACDCFVSLHRAEGFGRGIAEAMLLGKPVITTGFSGNLDFTRQDNALLVQHKLVALAPGDYLHGEGQSWADPDIAHAAQQMLTVVNQPKDIALLAARGQHTVASQHDLHSVGKRYEAALQQSGALPALPKPLSAPPASRRSTRQRASVLAS
jgi:glycosyltransferase involved in cell wall biosynthesis